MKVQIIVVWLVALATLQGSAAAEDWSSWNTAHSSWTTLYKNKDVQYRWRAATTSGSEECYLQLRDQKREPNHTTVVNVRVDYQYHDAESTRDVVTVMDVKGEGYGEMTVHHCVSVGNVHVTDIVR